MSLITSCIVLIWAIYRLVRIIGSNKNMMPNKVIIIMHIVSYLAIIILNAVVYFVFARSLRAYEISAMISLGVYCVCDVIFGLIVN